MIDEGEYVLNSILKDFETELCNLYHEDPRNFSNYICYINEELTKLENILYNRRVIKANKFDRDRTRNINVSELMKIENAFTKHILNLYRNFSMHNVRISTRRSSRYKLKPTEELKPTEGLRCDLYNQAEKVN